MLFNCKKSQTLKKETKKQQQLSKHTSKDNKHSGRLSIKPDVFRHVNSILYKCSSTEFNELKSTELGKSLQNVYHEGYKSKSKLWPTHPVSVIAESINGHTEPLIIFDLGCGDARLSRLTKTTNTLISVDLAPAPAAVKTLKMYKQPADYLKNGGLLIANFIEGLPFRPLVADIVVFSLSLMNTDWPRAINESFRLLKENGKLIIAELCSRLSDVKRFLSEFLKCGFACTQQKTLHNYFFIFWFEKQSPNKINDYSLPADLLSFK